MRVQLVKYQRSVSSFVSNSFRIFIIKKITLFIEINENISKRISKRITRKKLKLKNIKYFCSYLSRVLKYILLTKVTYQIYIYLIKFVLFNYDHDLIKLLFCFNF